MPAARKRQFLPAGGPVTAPTAEPAAAPAAAAASRALDVKTPAATPARTAFTWRRTADQALTMDELNIRLKRELGRPKLDQAQILAALVDIASNSPAVYGALVGKLQETDV